MKLEGLKKLIKEELAKVLKETSGIPEYFTDNKGEKYKISTYKNGDKYIKVNSTEINIQDPLEKQKIQKQIETASIKENQPMVKPTIKEPAIKEPERKKRRSLTPPEESPNTKPKALTVKEDEAKLVAKIAQRFKKLEK